MRYAIGAIVAIALFLLAWWLIGGAPNLSDPFRKKQVEGLVADTMRLHTQKLESQIEEYKARQTLSSEREASARNVQQFNENLASAQSTAQLAVSNMDAMGRKYAADMASIRYGMSLPTTERDSQVNTVVASLGARLKVYEDSLPILVKGFSDATAQIKTLDSQMGDMKERENAKDKALADVRSGVQDRITALSKGIFRKLTNGGKIRELRTVDHNLQELQRKHSLTK